MKGLTSWGAALAVVLCLSLSVSAQDVTKARQLLEQALEALKPAAPDVSTVIATADALTAALAGSDPVLTLSPTLVYPNSLTIRRSVTLQSTVPAGRMTREPALPKFGGGLTIAADNVTILGVEVRHTNPLTDIVVISGAHVTLDRVRVLGDPVKGAKRGIAANGNGDVKILRSFVDDAFQSYPGNDSQAVIAWDMGPGLTIEDCYLSAGSETIMIGGADPSSAERIPTNIVIRGNLITKNPAWKPLAIGVKNILELKDAKNVLIEDNELSYSWGGHGQDGYAFVATVRNQDGRAPFSTVQDVTFRNNKISHAAAAISLLGLDTIKETGTGTGRVAIGTVRPSVRMARVTIQGNAWTDLNPKTYTGSTKMILVDQAPEDVTIADDTFDGATYSSILYFVGSGGAAKNFTLRNVRVPRSTYGIFGGSTTAAATNFTATNPAWAKYTVGGAISAIAITP